MSVAVADTTESMRARLLLLLAALLMTACGGQQPPAQADPPPQAGPATHVGQQRCAACHAAEATAWTGSHHDLAMDPATAATVLGDFDAPPFTDAAGVTTSFRRDEDRFVVVTADAAGKSREYEVAYTFGVEPLQQYLVRFPDGRYQCLPVAWDSRPAVDGGQRWFHVYGDDPVPPGDALHWTGPMQNWNHMCAECHSTGLDKGYDAAADRFETTWAEIDVACEACHGPGSAHVAWAEAGADPTVAHGLTGLADARRQDWVAGGATLAPGPAARTNDREIQACARCHARAEQLLEEAPGAPLADTHRHEPMLPPTWHPDGQVRDEDYVFASFRASKMYHAGVTCSDCHEPHGLHLHAQGNALCARCHQPQHFDTPAHHHHAPGGPGANCVDCHMPETTYMQVDARRDHGFLVPRPAVSAATGSPDACTRCHQDQDQAWAAVAAERWWGPLDESAPDLRATRTIHAATSGDASAVPDLRALATEPALPAIRRAALIPLLLRLDPDPPRQPLFTAARDPDPLVRQAVADALRDAPQIDPVPIVGPLLEDPIRGVRLAAARCLAGRPLPERLRPAMAAAEALLEAGYARNADRAEIRIDRALTLQRRGDERAAAGELRRAIELAPQRIAAWTNLADLYRAAGDEAGCLTILAEGLRVNPTAGELHHALGLALVRGRRLADALPALARAAELRPDLPRFAYVLAVAQEAAGQLDAAIITLEGLLARHPGHAEARQALEAYRGR